MQYQFGWWSHSKCQQFDTRFNRVITWVNVCVCGFTFLSSSFFLYFSQHNVRIFPFLTFVFAEYTFVFPSDFIPRTWHVYLLNTIYSLFPWLHFALFSIIFFFQLSAHLCGLLGFAKRRCQVHFPKIVHFTVIYMNEIIQSVLEEQKSNFLSTWNPLQSFFFVTWKM